MSDAQDKSAVALLGDLVRQVSTLVQKELNLLRTEVSEKLNQAGVALGLIVAGAILAITALNVLTAALVAGLAALGIHGGWAALTVGVVIAVLAYLLIRKGTSDLKASRLAPERTLRSVRADAAAVEETMK